jgi:hypothetical protein
MAILDTEAAEGLTVFVCVDDKPLDEYDDDEEVEAKPGDIGEYQAANTVTKYVESTSDKEFMIQINVDPIYCFDSPTLNAEISIDGKYMTTPIIDPTPSQLKNKHLRRSDITATYGIQVPTAPGSSRAFLKKFKFAKIESS